MSIRLGENNYGKQRVRVLHRAKRDGHYDIKELTLGIRLEGEFESAHTKGDNHKILPTDTMKNTVYALALQHSIESPEQFCLRLLEHFLSRNPQVSGVHLEASETLWVRLTAGEQPRPHTFTRSGEEKRTASVHGSRDKQTVCAGIDGLVVLNATNSGFEGFLRDEYTTLKEDRNRILATTIRATWIYRNENVKFDEIWRGARQMLLTAFASHDSQSLQQTLYAMGEAVLGTFDSIRQISLSLPNKHYNLVDLSALDLDNPGEIFLPVDEPHGLIEATLQND